MSLTETDVDKTLPKVILKKLGHTRKFLIRRIISEKKNIYIYAVMQITHEFLSSHRLGRVSNTYPRISVSYWHYMVLADARGGMF